MKLGKTLSPLEPQQKINVIDGLYVHALTGQGIHPARDRAVSYPVRTFRKAPSCLLHPTRRSFLHLIHMGVYSFVP